jgi:hypothetical protein
MSDSYLCITLRHITLHYITLHYITLHYITLRYVTLHFITLHYVALHYITCHYVTFVMSARPSRFVDADATHRAGSEVPPALPLAFRIAPLRFKRALAISLAHSHSPMLPARSNNRIKKLEGLVMQIRFLVLSTALSC